MANRTATDPLAGLREFAAAHGLSQRELAVRSGLHESAISRLLNHDRNPNKATLDAILLACRQIDSTVGYDDLFSPVPVAEAIAS